MTAVLLLLASVVLLLLGHLFRILRWEQFIRIYERPMRGAMLRGLAGGYAVNFLLPFHIGDLFRAWFTGRKMKNGVGFALATVIMDRFLDVWLVTLLFGVFRLSGAPGIEDETHYYLAFSAALAVALVLVIRLRGPIKRLCLKVCGIFNDTLKLDGLVFCWSLINTFKDLGRVRLSRLAVNTGLMWASYLASYRVLAEGLSQLGADFGMVEVFTMLFGRDAVDVTSFSLTGQLHDSAPLAQGMMLAWYILPLLVMWAVTLLPDKMRSGINHAAAAAAPEPSDEDDYLNLLPQVDPRDRSAFLSQYFGLQNKPFVEQFLRINRGVTILEDHSAGSNATTMLCMDHSGTFWRKYAFGADGDKLAVQLEWLRAQEGRLPLCNILRGEAEPGCCWYDMEYSAQAVSMFRYLHSNPVEKSAAILRDVLATLDKTLYTPAKSADPAALAEYLDKKVDGNLARIREARGLRELCEYDRVWINGAPYLGLPALGRLFDRTYLTELFADDPIATIHGDLTLENIICRTGADTWYLIDPNTGNLHESPFLDYGKLLQSLHGGYEFMMMTPRVSVHENRIEFTFTRSAAYDALFAEVRAYLESRYTPRQVESIFLHELIHWLRLMPYKISKDRKRAPMFFAGLLMVANDIARWYPHD
ncbi:flippase-like domain-containing protein [Subdoligranulum sp. DSM 109015]|uniref:Phosphatidylglycerol lysyltransferase n=1 Tax=Gemmiger gallinarum TaxID=2779354 RepID=A0ABR9R404_9FIRM|nr:lysylphosphatidylglycerol synthase transmembrane domain-containing protein [Gemmiger gallinarum]MBE5037851.1 flippase-like domain-containing protein [Gemmiger gallinarum]